MPKSKSAYSQPTKFGKEDYHIIIVWVDNEAGVLARVIGLFSGRGYNIESLAVAEIDKKKHLSRITIVTKGTPEVIEQIKLQLGKLIPVHKVADFSRNDPKILFKELICNLFVSIILCKSPFIAISDLLRIFSATNFSFKSLTSFSNFVFLKICLLNSSLSEIFIV